MVWEAADRICGKRLKELLPTLLDAMGRHGHLDLDETVQGASPGDERRHDGPGARRRADH